MKRPDPNQPGLFGVAPARAADELPGQGFLPVEPARCKCGGRGALHYFDCPEYEGASVSGSDSRVNPAPRQPQHACQMYHGEACNSPLCIVKLNNGAE